MKFSCDRCGKRFTTTDDPVQGRIYRVPCRCGHLIVLRFDPPRSAPQRPPPLPVAWDRLPMRRVHVGDGPAVTGPPRVPPPPASPMNADRALRQRAFVAAVEPAAGAVDDPLARVIASLSAPQASAADPAITETRTAGRHEAIPALSPARAQQPARGSAALPFGTGSWRALVEGTARGALVAVGLRAWLLARDRPRAFFATCAGSAAVAVAGVAALWIALSPPRPAVPARAASTMPAPIAISTPPAVRPDPSPAAVPPRKRSAHRAARRAVAEAIVAPRTDAPPREEGPGLGSTAAPTRAPALALAEPTCGAIVAPAALAPAAAAETTPVSEELATVGVEAAPVTPPSGAERSDASATE